MDAADLREEPGHRVGIAVHLDDFGLAAALCLIASGKTNRQIAKELLVSLSTVKTHVQRIIRKLGVSDRTQATVKAIELGLL